jgi:hypothetical protein
MFTRVERRTDMLRGSDSSGDDEFVDDPERHMTE